MPTYNQPTPLPPNEHYPDIPILMSVSVINNYYLLFFIFNFIVFKNFNNNIKKENQIIFIFLLSKKKVY